MANWSTTDIYFRCENLFDYKTLEKSLNSIIEYDYIRTNESSIEIAEINKDMDRKEISISGYGRWAAPIGIFKDLSKISNSYLEFTDHEEGGDFFIHLIIEKGEIVKEIYDRHYCEEAFKLFGINYFDGLLYYYKRSYRDKTLTLQEIEESNEIQLLLKHGYKLEDLIRI